MHVVWHNLKRIEDERLEALRQRPPGLFNQSACFVQHHLALDNLAEEALPALSANCDEIRASACVVITAQPNRSPMMYPRIVCHV
jgi:hypothetical protein